MDEGYLKFRAVRRHGSMELTAECAERLGRLNAVRTGLFRLGLIGMNADGIGFGNISMRSGDGGRFVISGSATGGAEVLEAGRYCEILLFDLEKNEVTYDGAVPPSSETMSHGAVYRASGKARCVIHIHHAGMFAYMLSRGFAKTPEDAAFGTPRIAGEIMRIAGGSGTAEGLLVTAGHRDGVIAWGADMEETGRRLASLLEAACGRTE